jgi:RHS repeat-associated protein
MRRMMTEQDKGGPMCQAVPHYYLKDYLGNNREVVRDESFTIWTTTQRTEYTPFGVPYPQAVGDAGEQPFKFSGKEWDRMHGLNYYDFHARMYDPVLISFLTPDPLAEKYYGISPYVYCGNNPVNAIDPDGRKIVFVNGYLGFGNPTGGSTVRKGAHGSFVTGAQSYFGDNTTPYFTDVEHGKASTASWRHSKGYDYAKANYESIVEGMADGETFKLVSHSMGGAFSTGVQQYLEEQGWTVESSVFINTFQSGNVKTQNNGSTFIIDYQNTNDPVLFWLDINLGLSKIKNSNVKIREKSKLDMGYIHAGPISYGTDFWNNMNNMVDYQNRYTWNDAMNQINSWLQQNPNITVTYH